MRQTLLSIASLAALAAIGLQCTHADACDPDAVPVPPPLTQRPAAQTTGPTIELIDDGSRSLPSFDNDGRRFVLGDTGSRYRIRVVNPTARRVEAVVSVDGLDAIDGRTASTAKRGYIVPAYGELVVDGWRTSLDEVAAFRFSSVDDSYAGRKGQARNVGVIGAAFFEERLRPVVAFVPSALPPPSPPESRTELMDSAGASADAPAAKAQSAARALRPGLGTQFGEAQASHVVEIPFERAGMTPSRITELRYDDRAGLVARGIVISPMAGSREAENDLRDTAEPFPGQRFAQPPP